MYSGQEPTFITCNGESTIPLCYALRLLAARTGDEKVLELAPVQEAGPRYPVPPKVFENLLIWGNKDPVERDFATEEFAGLYNIWMIRKEIQRAVMNGKWQYLKNHFTPEQLSGVPENWDGAEVLGRKYKIQDADVWIRSCAIYDMKVNPADVLRCYGLISRFIEMREIIDWEDEKILSQKEKIEKYIYLECLLKKEK